MKTYALAVGIVQFNDQVLVLKRNPNKRFDPNKWEFVSGFIKEHETVEETILREIKEETTLIPEAIEPGKIFEVNDKYGKWIVIPFLAKVNSTNLKLSEEHTEFKWIKTKELKKFEAVADLKKDLESVGLI